MAVGGSRHYGGKGLGEIGIWKCPVCDAENTGSLGDGCQHCGAGSQSPRQVAPPVDTAPRGGPLPWEQAFTLYVGTSGLPPEASGFLQRGFEAGWHAALAQVRQQSTRGEGALITIQIPKTLLVETIDLLEGILGLPGLDPSEIETVQGIMAQLRERLEA